MANELSTAGVLVKYIVEETGALARQPVTPQYQT